MISPYRLMIINHSDTDIYNDIDWELPTTWLWPSDPRKDFCPSVSTTYIYSGADGRTRIRHEIHQKSLKQ